MFRFLLASALIAFCAAAFAADGPTPVSKSRIVVAPFCGLSPANPAESKKMMDEVATYCNAIYYAPWLFLDRTPSHTVLPNDLDPTEVNFLLSLSEQHKLPCILTLHWGPTGQPDMMDWIAKKYAPSQIWQMNINGQIAHDPVDPFSSLPCLVHPDVRYEIKDTYTKAMAAAKAHSGYKYVLCLGGTTEPMICRGEIAKCDDNKPSGYCFNPEHIKWWRGYLAKRWGKIEAFNKAFGTSYMSFNEVEPPKSLEQSPLFAEYERGLRQSLIDYETWQMKLMHDLDPELPLLNHIASVVALVSGGVRCSYTTFDGGSAQPGVPGGSVYTVPGHIADYAAVQMDGHRSFKQDDFAAIELGILGTWDGRGEEYKVWYSQMAARFEHVWTAPYAWAGGGSNLRGTDAKDGLLWGTKLGEVKVGKPKLPQVTLYTNYSAWSWDCENARNSQLGCYRTLYNAGIDRVLVSEYQVEQGWFDKNPAKVVILTSPVVMSRTVLEKLYERERKGLIIVFTGAYPEKDGLNQPLPSSLIESIKKNKNTIFVEKPEQLPSVLKDRLKLVNCLPGFEVVETSSGYCVVNVTHCKDAQRVTTPPEMQTVKLKINGKEISVPVQYFTYVDRKAEKSTWIDEKGNWNHN